MFWEYGKEEVLGQRDLNSWENQLNWCEVNNVVMMMMMMIIS
jgi:hypothetical protein